MAHYRRKAQLLKIDKIKRRNQNNPIVFERAKGLFLYLTMECDTVNKQGRLPQIYVLWENKL